MCSVVAASVSKGQKADSPGIITTISNGMARQAYWQWFYIACSRLSVSTFTGNTVNRQTGFTLRHVSATALHLAADRDDRDQVLDSRNSQLFSHFTTNARTRPNNPYTFGILEIVIRQKVLLTTTAMILLLTLEVPGRC
jgi:hypothetical protein